jgi:protein-L-isoaspartate(D-aspartate) O-methyltransferase
VFAWNHVTPSPSPTATCAGVGLADGDTRLGRFVALGNIKGDIYENADDQRRTSKELIELTRRDLRLHTGSLFPAGIGAHLAAGVETPSSMSEAVLRDALVSNLERAGMLRSPRIIAAMRKVARHRFVPELTPQEAYADRAVAIKTRDETILSSISQPGMIAQMLELLEANEGDRVLEIGTGSGYNAALLAEIVGPSGHVTTVELDAELADRARSTIESVGYRNVTVLVDDGTRVREPTFDRLVVTARTDDIAAAWWQMLPDGARIVVPLVLESVGEYAVGFVRRGDRLQSVGACPCAFIELRTQPLPGVSGVFYRDATPREGRPCIRSMRDVVAIPVEGATPQLLDEADVVIARPVSMFAVTFTS